MTDTQMSPKGQQHDDHCAAQELHVWKEWPALPYGTGLTIGGDIYAAAAEMITQPLYVISKSDSVEHLYWSARGWGPLSAAARYGRDTMLATPEPRNEGFWMDLVRAEELDE